MRVLGFDTETTGIFDFSKRADEDGQPRMIQFAGFLVDVHDDHYTIIEKLVAPIKPDGWTMPADLAEKLGHGLTQEYLEANGIPVIEVLHAYHDMHRRADLIICYGTQFDTKVIRAECRRAGLDDLYGLLPEFCVMKAATPLCKMAPTPNMLATGRRGPKTPKLGEAVEILLGRKLEGAHNAENDAIAMFDLFMWMKCNGIDVSGKVPASKLKSAEGGALPKAPAPALAPAAADSDALFSE